MKVGRGRQPVEGHRSGRRRRRGPVPARREGAPRPGRRESPPWSTSATTSGCTACGSAPTSTPACTPSAAASTPSAAGAARARRGRCATSWPRYGADPSWFGLGDRDIATHLVRTRMLRAGYPLSDVTAALCHRWQPGVTLLPGHRRPGGDPRRRRRPGQRRRRRARRSTSRSGGSGTRPSCPRTGSPRSAPTRPRVLPAARDAIVGADVVLLAPSNPVVSIGAHPGRAGRARRRCATRRRRSSGSRRSSAAARCAAWPTRCLTAIGVETTAEAVGRHYGARADGGLLDGWLVHTGDAADVPGRRGRARCRC